MYGLLCCWRQQRRAGCMMEVVAPLLGELGRTVCAAVASNRFELCCGPCVGEYWWFCVRMTLVCCVVVCSAPSHCAQRCGWRVEPSGPNRACLARGNPISRLPDREQLDIECLTNSVIYCPDAWTAAHCLPPSGDVCARGSSAQCTALAVLRCAVLCRAVCAEWFQ